MGLTPLARDANPLDLLRASIANLLLMLVLMFGAPPEVGTAVKAGGFFLVVLVMGVVVGVGLFGTPSLNASITIRFRDTKPPLLSPSSSPWAGRV
jgi:hypothetical protein